MNKVTVGRKRDRRSVTNEEIQFYIEKAHRMRAEAMRSMFVQATASIGSAIENARERASDALHGAGRRRVEG